MNTRDPLSDEKFTSVLSEVVWGCHVYGRYGGEKKKAIKAFVRRVPGYSTETYQKMFDISLSILKVTIEAVEKAPKSPKPGQKFTEYADVDMDYVMGELHSKFPEQEDELLSSHVGMAINWYYIR